MCDCGEIIERTPSQLYTERRKHRRTGIPTSCGCLRRQIEEQIRAEIAEEERKKREQRRQEWEAGRQTYDALTLDGVTRSVSDWSRLTGITRMTIYRRLRAGMKPEQVLRPTAAARRKKAAENGAGKPRRHKPRKV